jgi:hypothetical protein
MKNLKENWLKCYLVLITLGISSFLMGLSIYLTTPEGTVNIISNFMLSFGLVILTITVLYTLMFYSAMYILKLIKGQKWIVFFYLIIFPFAFGFVSPIFCYMIKETVNPANDWPLLDTLNDLIVHMYDSSPFWILSIMGATFEVMLLIFRKNKTMKDGNYEM